MEIGVDEIDFSKEERATIVGKLQAYFLDEMEVEVGRFGAEFLLDFISKELGVHYYNLGVNEAQAVLTQQYESMTDALYQLEKVTAHSR